MKTIENLTVFLKFMVTHMRFFCTNFFVNEGADEFCWFKWNELFTPFNEWPKSEGRFDENYLTL